MPANTGTCPVPADTRIDIRFENDWIKRERRAGNYDWRLGKDCTGMPIRSWQHVERAK